MIMKKDGTDVAAVAPDLNCIPSAYLAVTRQWPPLGCNHCAKRETGEIVEIQGRRTKNLPLSQRARPGPRRRMTERWLTSCQSRLLANRVEIRQSVVAGPMLQVGHDRDFLRQHAHDLAGVGLEQLVDARQLVLQN